MSGLSPRLLNLKYTRPTILRHPYSHILARRRFSSSSIRRDDVPDFGDYSVILAELEDPVVWGVAHIKPRDVPHHVKKPAYATQPSVKEHIDPVEPFTGDGRITLGGQEERLLREAASLAQKTRRFASSLVKVGATTNAIDTAIHDFIIRHSAYPSPLLYSGFPKSCCTSVNNIIAHGIPDDRPLEDGDTINIDVTVYLNGFHGDTSETFLVGNVDAQGRDLVNFTNEALKVGIDACGPGRPFRDIGKAIFNLARNSHYSVSSEFAGHGIGSVFHRDPWIVHTPNEEPGEMLPGHCFTIEPCVIQGSSPHGFMWPDGWTVSTENGARSAQAEHMILITQNGVDVLTR